MKKLISTIVVLVIVLWAGNSIWYSRALRAVDESDETRVTLTIPAGSSTSSIAALLKQEDLIRSTRAFALYVEDQDKAAALQAGSFVLRRNMTAEEIVESLSGGVREEVSVTIPEGYTVKDIDALLTEKGLITAGELIDCANTCDFSTFDFLPSGANLARRGGKVEGYLYPDTYFVSAPDFHPKFFIERLMGTFRTRVVNAFADEIKTSGRSVHQIVTMASLVEEETRTDDERAVVAGILWKRMDEGIGLYVDASNRYIADKPTAALTVADLDMDTPYNLRRYQGLPPGPIANPSVASIKAALNPEKSPYYYYLHGTDGQIRYAVTNDEHNVNKARYLR